MSSRNHNRAVVVTCLMKQTFHEKDMGKPAPLIGSWEEEFLLKDYPTPWAFLNDVAQAFIREQLKLDRNLYAKGEVSNYETRLIHTKVMGFRDTDSEIARIVGAIVNAELYYLK